LVDYLTSLRFDAADLEHLAATGLFHDRFLAELERLRFTGDVDAMPEGTICFPNEPIVRVTAPLPEAQFVETRLINLLHFQTMIASKAARFVLAARGKGLVDFGFRRAHGAEAGVLAARACYLAGFDGTATVLANPLFGIPIFGTMAHSYIEAHESEIAAFEHFVRDYRGNAVLLIDTYDTEAAAERVVELAKRLVGQRRSIASVRIDSGNLDALSRSVRRILDRAPGARIGIFVSGGLDEHDVARLLENGAPIDGFGIGTALDVSSDAPSLDCAYKLQEYQGRPRGKRSPGKATLPGRKQVFRRYTADGRFERDIVALVDDPQDGEPLLVPVMRNGKPIAEPHGGLDEARRRCRESLERLPQAYASLDRAPPFPVEIDPAIERLAAQIRATST
ncbi:MAG: nicotinate phosphoribosyltransferase, partial [Gammaproteobacteria bacterium]